MTSIVAISGSLRRASFNTALARTAAAAAPEGSSLEVATLHGIPLYDGDAEAASGLPPAVVELKARVVAAQGLLLVSPEYNGSIPGVLKNAIDWLSRPPADLARVFGGLPVGIIGATPGPAGTRLAQTAWLPVLRQLGCVPYFGKSVFLAAASTAFDDTGTLVDAKLRELVRGYVEGFVAFARAHGRG
ncbi:MAG: NADPH-dependent FMN reductase [Nannocystaceae bacterium]